MYRAAGADCCCELNASCSGSELLVWRAAVSTSCYVAGVVVGLVVVVNQIRGIPCVRRNVAQCDLFALSCGQLTAGYD